MGSIQQLVKAMCPAAGHPFHCGEIASTQRAPDHLVVTFHLRAAIEFCDRARIGMTRKFFRSPQVNFRIR
ncbi:MAG: hypothetical protein R6U51_04925 [Anaerolineales bacterium]